MDEFESTVKPPAALPPRRCPSCGTVMDAKGVAPGTWRRCPSCGQPVRFEAPKAPPRPTPAPKPVVAPPPLSRPAAPAWTPRPSVSRRIGCAHASMIATMAGFAQMIFVAAVLDIRNPFELLYSALFGFVLVWVSGSIMLAASSRSGWDDPKNRPPF